MPATITKGRKAVWGIQPQAKKISNVPEGAKVRLKIAENQLAKAYVRTSDGIKEHALFDNGDTWELTWPLKVLTRVEQHATNPV